MNTHTRRSRRSPARTTLKRNSHGLHKNTEARNSRRCSCYPRNATIGACSGLITTPSDHLVYDVVIFGGGISGLYTAYSLLRQSPELRLLLVEKQPDLGGRVYTYRDKHMVVETGAGRFSNHHKLLRKLIRELDLAKHVVPIHGGFSYRPVATSHTADVDGDGDAAIAEIIRASKKTSANTLRRLSFIDYAKRIVGKTRAKHILDSFGYYSELVLMNAYDAIHLMRVLDTHSTTNRFFGLSGGLSQIIERLAERIQSYTHATIWRGKFVVDVAEMLDKSFTRRSSCVKLRNSHVPTIYKCSIRSRDDETSLVVVHAKTCVFALPKRALEKLPIFRPLSRELGQVSCGALCRIYSYFGKRDRKWMCELRKDAGAKNEQRRTSYSRNATSGACSELGKITTNNDLRMIIPIDPDNGVIMITYTDNVFAERWHNLYRDKGVDAVNRRIAELLRETLGVDIPTPAETKVFFWSCGVGYWNVGANSSQVAKRMIHPFPHKRIYICGEHFSASNQQWMEGALETSQEVVRKIRE